MVAETETWYELEILGGFGWIPSMAWNGFKWKSYNDCLKDVTSYHPENKLTQRQRIVKKTFTTEVVSP